MRSFLSAIGFLTKIPLPNWAYTDQDSLAASPPYFPLAGVALGLGLAVFDNLASRVFPLQVACVLDLVFVFAVTGGMHCDGLIDTADGLLGGRTRKDALCIMRDSRIGAMGGIALALLILAKFVLLVSLQGFLQAPEIMAQSAKVVDVSGRLKLTGGTNGRLFRGRLPFYGRLPALLLAPVIGRWAILLAIVLFPYARKQSGMGTVFTGFYEGAGQGLEQSKKQGKERSGQSQTPGQEQYLRLSDSRKRFCISSTLTACYSFAIGGTRGVVALVLAGCFTWFWARRVSAFLGGLTGDVYGAISEICEIITLLVFCLQIGI